MCWGKASHVRVSRVPSSEKEKEMQRLQDERELGVVEELEQVGEEEAGRVHRIQITEASANCSKEW